MSAHVLGLDLGLAHLGAAQLHDDGRIYTQHLETATPPCAEGHPKCADHRSTIVDVEARITAAARWAVERATVHTALAVIEGPAFAAKFGQPHERAGVWWAVVRALIRHEIPVAVLSPSTLKGYLAGNGNASKAEVQAAVAAAWPKQFLDRVTSHEAEAAGLATAGADHLGWSGPWLAGRRGTGWLKKAWWPDVASPAEVSVDPARLRPATVPANVRFLPPRPVESAP